MIPGSWYAGLATYLWQVILHSGITGLVFYAWARRLDLPSGRGKRSLLAVVLILPLVTAAIPGRGSREFREQRAWLDSGRVLAISLVGGVRVGQAVVALAVLTAALTLWQEVLPPLRRRRGVSGEVPDRLARGVRGLPGWDRCEIVLAPSEGIALATGGWPWRPRLLASRGALARLAQDELDAALLHEHAHWQAGRWMRTHALFLVRVLQCHNPVALWAFREYCLEVEIECDAAAVAGGDRRPLARALLKIYEATDRRDVATRSVLRQRVDVLLDPAAHDDAVLPLPATAVAAAVLLVGLPWVV